MKLLKMLFCKHEWIYVRYLHGDEINHHNGKRNEYKCQKCGRYKYTMNNTSPDCGAEMVVRK